MRFCVMFQLYVVLRLSSCKEGMWEYVCLDSWSESYRVDKVFTDRLMDSQRHSPELNQLRTRGR